MYVRSAIGGTTWLSVLDGTSLVDGQGYNIGLGVGCIDMAIGQRIVLLDRPPQDPGARILQTVFLRDDESQPSAISVDIDASGSAAQGVGKPDWWQGDASAC